MSTYAFAPPPQPSVAVAGEDARFPVRRVFCVGRNYAKHAVEMGADPDRDPPFFFAKPADAVIDASDAAPAQIPYPPQTSDFHHEIELAVAIRRAGRDVSPDDALGHVFGYAVALDLTRRDLQAAAKKASRPWAFAKGFDRSAPIAPIHRASAPMRAGRIWLEVDGEIRQDADLTEMIWPVPDVIAFLSRSMTIAPGDLILTGTPAGVGPLSVGQTCRGGIDGLTALRIDVVEPAA